MKKVPTKLRPSFLYFLGPGGSIMMARIPEHYTVSYYGGYPGLLEVASTYGGIPTRGFRTFEECKKKAMSELEHELESILKRIDQLEAQTGEKI
jgi:hypothetical protein